LGLCGPSDMAPSHPFILLASVVSSIPSLAASLLRIFRHMRLAVGPS